MALIVCHSKEAHLHIESTYFLSFDPHFNFAASLEWMFLSSLSFCPYPLTRMGDISSLTMSLSLCTQPHCLSNSSNLGLQGIEHLLPHLLKKVITPLRLS